MAADQPADDQPADQAADQKAAWKKILKIAMLAVAAMLMSLALMFGVAKGCAGMLALPFVHGDDDTEVAVEDATVEAGEPAATDGAGEGLPAAA